MKRGMPAIWVLIRPLVIYYVGYYLIRMVVGTLLAESGIDFLMEEGSPLVKGIAMLGGMAALFPLIGEEAEEQRKEKRKRGEDTAQQENEGEQKSADSVRPVLRYLALAVFAVASIVFFNTLISLSGLAGHSAAFQTVWGVGRDGLISLRSHIAGGGGSGVSIPFIQQTSPYPGQGGLRGGDERIFICGLPRQYRAGGIRIYSRGADRRRLLLF